MISNNAYYELFASYTVPDHNRVGYWVDLGANSKGKVIKTYNENLKKWVKVTDATSEDAVAPFIGNNGNWWIDNRDTGIHASGHSPYIGHNGNWFVHSSERNEHIDTGLPSRGEAGPKGDKGDKGNDATINGVGSIKIEAGDNITITQSDDTLTIIGDVQKPDLSNYATKTEVTNLNNKLQDAVSSVFRAKGSVKTYNNLPVDSVSIGDVYNVSDTGANYVAISINPITWDKLSETVDLSKFFNKEEINSLLSTKVDKQEGKQLTTEDFTTVLKRKLEGLSNYNDTEIRNAIDSLESAFNTLVEGNATVAIDTFNEIVSFLKNIENSQDLDSIIAGINTTISKVEAKIPDTNNFLSKDGGTMNNTNLVGNLNAELLNGYSSDKFVSIINHIKDSTTTDALTVGLNTINQDYLWTNTPYGDIATLVDISYSPDWRSLFFISPSTGKIHTRFKYNVDTWTNWKEIAFTDGSVANADMLDGYHESAFLRYRGETSTAQESTLWNSLGIKQYINALPDGIGDVYNYGEVISLPGDNVRFDIYVSNVSTADHKKNGIYVRSGWSSNKQPWRRLAFTDDPVAAANKLSTTRYIWGQPFDGSGNVKGVIKGVPYVSFETYDYEGGSAGYVGRGGTNSNDLSITTYGENSIEFLTNGLERMRITNDGLIGIGTPIPSSELHVIGKPIFHSNKRYGNAGAMHIQNDYAITGWDRAINLYYPNMGNGANATIHIGAIDSEKNGGYIAYHHAGYKSDNNCMKIGLYSVDDILNVTANRHVGINTTTPRGTLDVNGTATFSSDLYLFNDRNIFINADGEGMYVNKNGLYWHNSNNEYVRELIVFNDSGYVGIGIDSPEHKLDVNGSSIFRDHIYVKKYYHIFMNTGGEGVYYTDEGLYWHNADNSYHSSILTSDGNIITIHRRLYIESGLFLTRADQINGERGLALNYNCDKYVNTSIWDGQANEVMRVFGENKRVAIGLSSIKSPQGRLNVDGDVIFENSRFITTSGFTDGEYAHYHAIYGGYHGSNVCEFYEDEFKFKGNGGITTLLNLTSNDAVFSGTIQTHSCQYIGKFNGKTRFWLGRDGATNTWLQAATDTSNEGGRLCMSGYNGTTLSEFKVYASNVTCTGNILANGDVTAYSDIRLKNRMESVNNVLDTIDTLDVFKYTWKGREDKSVHIGVSAQQVQTIYPEFVLTSSSEDGADYLTVNYAALATCIAIQGIKELVKKGDERDKRIAALEGEVISLKEQLRYGNK